MPHAILFVFAHPDDESFAGAGTAMKYAAAGARVVLVTAIGERGGSGDPPVCAPGELAACRERELRHAAAIIGVDELHLLGFRDRQLSEADPGQVRRPLVATIRRVQPSVVITFRPARLQPTSGSRGDQPAHLRRDCRGGRFTLAGRISIASCRWSSPRA